MNSSDHYYEGGCQAPAPGVESSLLWNRITHFCYLLCTFLQTFGDIVVIFRNFGSPALSSMRDDSAWCNFGSFIPNGGNSQNVVPHYGAHIIIISNLYDKSHQSLEHIFKLYLSRSPSHHYICHTIIIYIIILIFRCDQLYIEINFYMHKI